MALSRGFVRNAATTPEDTRLMDKARFVRNSDGTTRTGALADGGSLVTALASMNVQVAAGEFVVSKGAADGVVVLTNDGGVNVPISAAPASNSRITSIWVKQNDNTTGDANSTPVFGTTDGTAAASPVAPAIPTGALELAQLRVYSGTSAANGGSNTLTQTFRMTAARGGVVVFRTKGELDAWSTPMLGQPAYTLDEDHLYVWTGGPSWLPVIGEWITYTPAQTGITLGTGGSITGRYRKVGRRIEVRIRVVLGTGGGITAQPIISLPVGTEDAGIEWFPGECLLRDAGGSEWKGIVRKHSSSQIAPYALSTALGYSAFANVTGLVPFTWASGDSMSMLFTYDVAA